MSAAASAICSSSADLPTPPHRAPPAPDRVPTVDPQGGNRAPRALAGGPTVPTSAQVACAYLSAHRSAPAHRRGYVSKALAFPDASIEAPGQAKTRWYGDCHLQPNDRQSDLSRGLSALAVAKGVCPVPVAARRWMAGYWHGGSGGCARPTRCWTQQQQPQPPGPPS